MITLQLGDSLELCKNWDSPTIILVDGPYGVGGYDGDLRNANGLAEWYEPHIATWAEKSTPLTTLWFWGTEVSWAEVHPILKKYGWVYRSCNIWDKGIAHVAGNTNTKTLRRFPVVTEVCAHYVRRPLFVCGDNDCMTEQDWLRSEWLRTGLPLNKSNDACGVKNAATRKYLTTDHCWYYPPPDVFEKLVNYANEFGNVVGKPYFAINGSILSGSQWEQMRGKFHCEAGITNVWSYLAVRGSERLKIDGKVIHSNQKPLYLMEMVIRCSSDVGDVVWEPFGGLCSASIAAEKLGRISFAAEIDEKMFEFAEQRINTFHANQTTMPPAAV